MTVLKYILIQLINVIITFRNLKIWLKKPEKKTERRIKEQEMIMFAPNDR